MMESKQKDPIMAELRAIRRAYAARFDYDVEAMFEDIRARQEASGREYVRLPGRRVVPGGDDGGGGEKTESGMDLKEAVRAGRVFIDEVFADEDTSDTRLEEVEYDGREEAWNITFSFLRPTGTVSTTDVLLPSGPSKGTRNVRRDYKVVTVDSSSGRATSIRHRSLETAE